MLDAKTPKARDRRKLEQDWHLAAETTLQPMGIAIPPMVALAKLSFVASYRKGIVAAEDYADAMKPGGRADRVRARLLIAANLLEWMRKCRVPVSFKSFAQNLQNAPTAMEAAYPGWRQSGLLCRVLTSKAD